MCSCSAIYGVIVQEYFNRMFKGVLCQCKCLKNGEQLNLSLKPPIYCVYRDLNISIEVIYFTCLITEVYVTCIRI